MKILILNTGGTFNKIYNYISGDLEVPRNNLAVEHILGNVYDNINYKIIGIIFKDSLALTNIDREKLSDYIEESDYEKIIIIHGTDTMNITASFLENKFSNKKIILVGAIKPVSLNPIDGVLNLGIAIGYINSIDYGVYISMSGLCLKHDLIHKNRGLGKFVKKFDNISI